MSDNRLAFARTTPEHVAQVVANLRREDARELAAASDADPAARLNWARENGDARSIMVAGEPVAIIGCVAQDGGGSPWMVATSNIIGATRLIVRHFRRWVRAYRRKYGPLMNAADRSNKTHARLIEWCGFEWGESFDRNGVTFTVFRYV